MSPQVIALRQKLVEILKGVISKEDDPLYQIRLLKGAVATGQELLVELRALEISKSRTL